MAGNLRDHDDQAMSPWGQDTNYALLASSVAAFAQNATESDFAVVPGDFLAHEFETKAGAALGVSSKDEKVRDMAVKTTLFVGKSLAEAFPVSRSSSRSATMIWIAATIEITPGGSYLAGTREMVRRLAGADLVAPISMRPITPAAITRFAIPGCRRPSFLW